MHSYSYSYGYGKLSLESIDKSLNKIALKNRRAYERIENAAKYACKSKYKRLYDSQITGKCTDTLPLWINGLY